MQITSNINSFNNVNFQGKKKNNPNKVDMKTMALAYAGGSLADFLVKAGYDVSIGNAIYTGCKQQTTENLGEVITNAIKYTHLDKKGVEFIDLAKAANTEEATKIAEQALRTEYNADKLGKFLLNNPVTKPKHEKILHQNAKMMGAGNNACVLMNTNKILLNSEKIGYAAFHEIGHSLNKNFSKLGRTLQKMRVPMSYIPGVLLTTALLTNKRTEENKPQNFWQKTTNFVKNNVGKLTTLTFVPTIIEELMASHKGMKLAKGMLDKNQLKQVAKTNILGAMTYIGVALVTGYAASIANKVRDGIVEKRQAEKMAKAAEAAKAQNA